MLLTEVNLFHSFLKTKSKLETKHNEEGKRVIEELTIHKNIFLLIYYHGVIIDEQSKSAMKDSN